MSYTQTSPHTQLLRPSRMRDQSGVFSHVHICPHIHCLELNLSHVRKHFGISQHECI